MLKIFILLCVLSYTAICQDWGSRACMVNPLGFFTQVIQETVTELETNKKWSNFKMDNISTPVDIELYNLHMVGTVNFTNGFLISTQKIDISNFLANIATSTVNGEQTTIATMRGNFNLHQMKIGFDVDIDFQGHEKMRVTGVFGYRIVSWTYFLTRNLHTNHTTVEISGSSSVGESTHMEFLPTSTLTEVASRFYNARSSGNTFPRWGQEIQEVILEKAQEVDFPEIRFDNNC